MFERNENGESLSNRERFFFIFEAFISTLRIIIVEQFAQSLYYPRAKLDAAASVGDPSCATQYGTQLATLF